mgnify:CR=1 FL=1
MSLNGLNIVNGEYDMRYYSIRMKLDDVIKDKDTEQTILENIRRCSNIVGKEFKVVFWHENLSEQDKNTASLLIDLSESERVDLKNMIEAK